MEVTQFYDALAHQYDAMTGRERPSQALRQTLTSLVRATQIKSVVDVGCGTGWHAVLLAQMGLRVAGVDVSEKMLARAQALALSLQVPITWHQGEMTHLDKLVGSGWDAVLCIGNTLPHLLRLTELRRFASAVCRSLAKGGLLVTQSLNYELLQRRDERIVALTRSDTHAFIRFNDYLRKNRVRFNLLEINWVEKQPAWRLSYTFLRPWRPGELVDVFQRAGFNEVSVYNNLHFSPFDPNSARSFVVVARKNLS